MDVKSRQAQFNENIGQPKSDNDLRSALKIPNTLFTSFSLEQKRAFLHWKNVMVNGETIPNEDIIKMFKQEDGDDSQKSRKGKKRKNI
eukprot:1678620-Ditylum_brightwellii.AAC.1